MWPQEQASEGPCGDGGRQAGFLAWVMPAGCRGGQRLRLLWTDCASRIEVLCTLGQASSVCAWSVALTPCSP